jgi:hypothetical protein
LLKPSGTLIVAVPNFKSFDANITALLGSLWRADPFWHFFKSDKKYFWKEDMQLEKYYPWNLTLLCEPVIWKIQIRKNEFC